MSANIFDTNISYTNRFINKHAKSIVLPQVSYEAAMFHPMKDHLVTVSKVHFPQDLKLNYSLLNDPDYYPGTYYGNTDVILIKKYVEAFEEVKTIIKSHNAKRDLEEEQKKNKVQKTNISVLEIEKVSKSYLKEENKDDEEIDDEEDIDLFGNKTKEDERTINPDNGSSEKPNRKSNIDEIIHEGGSQDEDDKNEDAKSDNDMGERIYTDLSGEDMTFRELKELENKPFNKLDLTEEQKQNNIEIDKNEEHKPLDTEELKEIEDEVLSNTENKEIIDKDDKNSQNSKQDKIDSNSNKQNSNENNNAGDNIDEEENEPIIAKEETEPLIKNDPVQDPNDYMNYTFDLNKEYMDYHCLKDDMKKVLSKVPEKYQQMIINKVMQLYNEDVASQRYMYQSEIKEFMPKEYIIPEKEKVPVTNEEA